MDTKRKVYIGLFTLVGIIIGFELHAAIELTVLKYLTANFAKYNLGYSWAEWKRFHDVLLGVLLVLGGFTGYRQGKYWWSYLYSGDIVVEPYQAHRKKIGLFFAFILVLSAAVLSQL